MYSNGVAYNFDLPDVLKALKELERTVGSVEDPSLVNCRKKAARNHWHTLLRLYRLFEFYHRMTQYFLECPIVF